MKSVWNTLTFLLVLVLFAGINLVVHELGHCYTIDTVGGKCVAVYVMPGVQIWPLREFGQRYPELWDDYAGLTLYGKTAPTEPARGFVSLMGSGSVAALSLLALFGLYIFRPRGRKQFPLLAQSFMFLDLLLYTILPRWFGFRHFFFIGGITPEPLNGAIKMGIPESMFITGVLTFSVLMFIGCLAYVWQSVRRHV